MTTPLPSPASVGRLDTPMRICLTAVCDTPEEVLRAHAALSAVQLGLALEGVFTVATAGLDDDDEASD